MLSRALYRASLRCVRSLDGRSLVVQRGIDINDWGSYQYLTAEEVLKERAKLFPWCTPNTDADSLRAVVRLRFRELPATDAALDDGIAALRKFGELFEAMKHSSECVTQGIRIEALSQHLGVSDEGAHLFAYRIRISNLAERVVRLKSRHWTIADGNNDSVVVVPKGSPGVVGQTPILEQHAYFEYVSGTEIQSPNGSISGSIAFVYADDGQTVEANVGKFALSAPDAPDDT